MTEPITLHRLEELTVLLDSPSLVPGPLDIQDMKAAIVELIGHREATAVSATVTVGCSDAD